MFKTGIPDFIARPKINLDVNEDSTLQLQVKMEGNPPPSADFRWPHLTGSTPTNVASVQLYPFVYSSTYKLNHINARDHHQKQHHQMLLFCVSLFFLFSIINYSVMVTSAE